jgi:hypothetical protein
MATVAYKLVQLANGSCTLYSLAHDEKMHPGPGPTREAKLLCVDQLRIRERLARHAGEFVVWDVGLGAAANAIAVMRAAREFAGPLRLVSFDNTPAPLAFALAHAGRLGYFDGYEERVRALLNNGAVCFTDGAHQVDWQLHLDDFPSWLERQSPIRRESDPSAQRGGLASEGARTALSASSSPAAATHGQGCPRSSAVAPDAILFDAFSPAKNPAMWTLPMFTNLFRLLDPARPCALTTYSRSTMIRVTLLLAGFFVGRGVPTGSKEETTVAANTLKLIDAPLDRRWLERAQRSDSAEPLHQPKYRRARLSQESWEKLQAHPQFAT